MAPGSMAPVVGLLLVARGRPQRSLGIGEQQGRQAHGCARMLLLLDTQDRLEALHAVNAFKDACHRGRHLTRPRKGRRPAKGGRHSHIP